MINIPFASRRLAELGHGHHMWDNSILRLGQSWRPTSWCADGWYNFRMLRTHLAYIPAACREYNGNFTCESLWGVSRAGFKELLGAQSQPRVHPRAHLWVWHAATCRRECWELRDFTIHSYDKIHRECRGGQTTYQITRGSLSSAWQVL